jgi:hypothetical protein
MATIISRSQWGARPAQGSMNSIDPTPIGTAVHWEGPQMGTQDHSLCDDTMRGIQNYHMDTKGWADIAYSLCVCQHGYVYEGRGKGKGSAANGTTQGNYDYYAVCALVGENDPQPTVLDDGIANAVATCKSWGAGSKVVGHRDLIGTECPGDSIYSKVKSGRYGGGSAAGGGGGSGGGSGGGTKAPAFPYPSSDYLGTVRSDPHCHSGYYASDQPNVRTWQQQMKNRGWTIGVDGVFGSQSEGVARQFQSEKGLASDGLVGPSTWSASWSAPVT